MAADKQLILVLDGTADMATHWQTIVSDYLEKIVRNYCKQTAEQSDGTIAAETFELGLVQFNTRSFMGAMLMRSGWTRDVDRFVEWLSCMRFSGGGVDDPETAEGLGDALMMFAVPENGYMTGKIVEGKRQCILVTTNNPCECPAPVYRPNIKESGPPPLLSDAVTVARWFGKCNVSLSVICARKLRKVRALYEAAKRNPSSEDQPIHLQHPRFLVLISESFVEAHDALNPKGLVPPQDSAKSLDPNSGASSSSQPVGPLASKEPLMVIENMALASLDLEPSVADSLASSHAHPCLPTFLDAATMSMLGNSMPLAQSKYVKLWEGNLLGRKKGEAVLISRVEVYRNTLASARLAANWPESLQVVRLKSQDQINNEKNVASAVLLVFRVLNNHPFINQLLERKLCAVVELQYQTLLLSASEKATLLIGTLLSRDA